ncbi:hypothetical protein [Maribellus maritimus]|nr:hypothetical protein [Maribellus maritimus]MCG6191235.1 hypothetical protein [Maribellus maritimus]
MELMYERVRDYNNYGSDVTIALYDNLWALPQSQIDLNTGIALELNPGNQ